MIKELVKRCIRHYVRTALVLALRLFAPRGGFLPPSEPVLDGFSIVRGTVGALVLFFINAVYGTDLGGVTGLPLTPPSLADPWVVGGAPVVIGLLAVVALWFTRRGYRRRATYQLLCPIRAVIIFVVLATAGRWVLPLEHYSGVGLTAIGVELLSQLAVFWYLIFVWCAVWCCAAGPFRAADGHPLLAPVAATAFAWLAAVHALTAHGLSAATPHVLYFAAVVGGPATVTAMSALEVCLLRARFPSQFPFREGPLVTQSQRAAPWTGIPLVAFLRQQLIEFRKQLKEVRQRLARRNWPHGREGS